MIETPTSWALVGILATFVAGMAVTVRDPSHRYLFVGLSLAAGIILICLWRRGDVSTQGVLTFALFFRLLLFFLPPVLSDDAFRYVWDGWLQREGINPYRFVPADPALAEWHDEALFARLNSEAFYSVYPPVSQIVFAVGGLVQNGGWPASYMVIKAAFVVLEATAVFVLARMVGPRALMLYAWHPLVLVEIAGQAHTEAAMVFFLVLAVYLNRRGSGAGTAAAAVGAGWTKLYPFVLLPLVWRRHGWKAVLTSIVVGAALVAPYAAPYLLPHLRASLDLYVRYFEFNAGLYYAIKEVFRVFTGEDWSKVLGPVFRGLYLASLPVLYVLDVRRSWSFARASLIALGLFFLLSTTIHPWYLLGILVLCAVLERPAWHWQWLALSSIGTYLLYTGGPYWFFVIVGWTGWLVVASLRYRHVVLNRIQQYRAARKVRRIRSLLPDGLEGKVRILDLGAGEGYVGQELARRLPADVQLADVIPMNRTGLPHVVYDGKHLPFEENAFDVTVVYFVLHHAEDPLRVAQEAARVSRERVIVVESVYDGVWDRRLLEVLDRLVNRLRSGGAMRDQEQYLRFRTVDEWRRLLGRAGEVEHVRRWGRWIHKQALFIVRPPAANKSVIAQ